MKFSIALNKAVRQLINFKRSGEEQGWEGGGGIHLLFVQLLYIFFNKSNSKLKSRSLAFFLHVGKTAHGLDALC